jgi:polar amino acid transport system permease protein
MDLTRGHFLYEAWMARAPLLHGVAITIEVSVVVIILGSLIGLVGGLLLVYGRWWMRAPIRLYVDVLRGIPVLVLILFSYYGLALFNVNVTPTTAGIIALGGFCGAHMSETIRGAIQSIPVGQSEAAKAIGLRFGQRLRHVVLPQAMRRMLPPWVNTAVEMVKGTTLLSIIGVVELLLATQQAVARNYLTIQFYFMATIIYLVINFTISQLGAALERRFSYLKY